MGCAGSTMSHYDHVHFPGSHARTRRCEFPRDFPIWPCSRWGLPCHARCRPRGALLPHHFTLTCVAFPDGELAHRRYLSVALSVGSRLPGVTWHRVRRSPDFPPHLARNAAALHRPPVGRREVQSQWNCSSSVEPVRAFTEDDPPWITVVTSSKYPAPTSCWCDTKV